MKAVDYAYTIGLEGGRERDTQTHAPTPLKCQEHQSRVQVSKATLRACSVESSVDSSEMRMTAE